MARQLVRYVVVDGAGNAVGGGTLEFEDLAAPQALTTLRAQLPPGCSARQLGDADQFPAMGQPAATLGTAM